MAGINTAGEILEQAAETTAEKIARYGDYAAMGIGTAFPVKSIVNSSDMQRSAPSAIGNAVLAAGTGYAAYKGINYAMANGVADAIAKILK